MRNLLTFVLPVSLLLLLTAMTPSLPLQEPITGLAEVFYSTGDTSGAGTIDFSEGGTGGTTGGLNFDTTNKGIISPGAGGTGGAVDFGGIGGTGSTGGLGDVQVGGTTGGVSPTAPTAGSGVNLGGTTAGGVFGESVGTPTQSFYFPVVFPTVQSPSNVTINPSASTNQQSSVSNLSAAQQLFNQSNAVQSLIQGVLVFPNTNTVTGPNDLCITQRQTELQNALISCNGASSCENKAKSACVVAMKDRCKQDQGTAESLCSVSAGGSSTNAAAIVDAQTKTIYVPATTNFVQATIENVDSSGNIESQTITLLPSNAVISSKPLNSDDVKVVIKNVPIDSGHVSDKATAGAITIEVNKASKIIAELTTEASGEKIETSGIGVIVTPKPTLLGVLATGFSNLYNQVLNVLSSIGIGGGGSGSGGGTGGIGGGAGGQGGNSFGTTGDTTGGGGGGCKIISSGPSGLVCSTGPCTTAAGVTGVCQEVQTSEASQITIAQSGSKQSGKLDIGESQATCACVANSNNKSPGTILPTCPAPVSKITPLKPSVTFSKTVTIRMKSPSGAKTTTCSLPGFDGDLDKCDTAHLVTQSVAGTRPAENQGQDQDGDGVISSGEQYNADVQGLLSLGMYYGGGTEVQGNEGVIAEVNAAGDTCTEKFKEVSTPKIQCLPENKACATSRVIKAEYTPNKGCKKTSTSFEPDTYQSNDSSSPKPVGDRGASGSVENAALITGTLTVVWEGDESFEATMACSGSAVEIPPPPEKETGGEEGGGDTGGGGGGSEVPENREKIEPLARNFGDTISGFFAQLGSDIADGFKGVDNLVSAIGDFDIFRIFAVGVPSSELLSVQCQNTSYYFSTGEFGEASGGNYQGGKCEKTQASATAICNTNVSVRANARAQAECQISCAEKNPNSICSPNPDLVNANTCFSSNANIPNGQPATQIGWWVSSGGACQARAAGQILANGSCNCGKGGSGGGSGSSPAPTIPDDQTEPDECPGGVCKKSSNTSVDSVVPPTPPPTPPSPLPVLPNSSTAACVYTYRITVEESASCPSCIALENSWNSTVGKTVPVKEGRVTKVNGTIPECTATYPNVTVEVYGAPTPPCPAYGKEILCSTRNDGVKGSDVVNAMTRLSNK